MLDRLSGRVYVAIAASIIAGQALIEHFMGRVAICTCGYVKLWEGEVLSAGNSQHLSDWYTFSHFIHGFGFYLLLWLFAGRLPIGLRFVLAVLAESCWEVLENTDMVIERYRAATISLNYYGDSILNSVSDTLSAVIGFWFARWMPVKLTIAAGVAMEIGVGIAIRDNFTLNMLMLLHPIHSVEAWQAAGQRH